MLDFIVLGWPMEKQSIMDDMNFPTFSVPGNASPLVSHSPDGQSFIAFFLRQDTTKSSQQDQNSWFVFLHLLSAGVADTCHHARLLFSLVCVHFEGKLKQSSDERRLNEESLTGALPRVRSLRWLSCFQDAASCFQAQASPEPFRFVIQCSVPRHWQIPEMVMKQGANLWGY